MIDASIPLQAHGLGPLVNPMEVVQQAQQVRLQRERAAAEAEDRRAQAAQRQAQTDKLQRDAAKEADGDAAVNEFLTTYKPGVTPMPTALVGRMYRAYGPERANAIVKMATDAQTADLATAEGFRASAQRRLVGVLALPADKREAAYNAATQDYVGRGLLKPEEIPPWSPETETALSESILTPDQRYKIHHPTPIDHDPTHALLNPDGTVLRAAEPKAPTKPASAQEFEYRNSLAPDQQAAYDKYQTEDANRRRSVVNVNAAAGASNVKDVIAGMKDGTIPPQMPGRASKEYVELLAEAKRQGYNLAAAVTDWNATQKHISTMNGAQQLRLNQAINSLPDMLDKVDALASQWKGGQFPILNKANLALAKGGAYGSQVASVANQLDAQIADVTADLGNVYMGGNSPTDHALGLAGKSLKGEWDEKVLHDMVKLAKANVQIRHNSIASTGVAGASDTNPYDPSNPPAPRVPAPQNTGTIRARDPQGNIHEAKAGTPLPAGWTLMGGGK